MKDLIVWVGMIMCVSTGALAALAQEEDDFSTSTSSLQDALSILRQNAEKLNIANDRLTLQDRYINQQISQLQAQLQQLRSQGDLLNKSALELQEKTPRRSEQLARLEEENSDLDDRIQKTQGDIQVLQQSLDGDYQQERKLLLGLKEAAVPAGATEDKGSFQRQKEKLKLMDMIHDSQQRQASLYDSILKLQQSLPITGALARQQLLKEKIEDLETRIGDRQSSMHQTQAGSPWDNDQLNEMSLELKVLERNYDQLRGLTQQMNRKNQNIRITTSERVEEEKLQNTINNLDRKGQTLMVELDDVRTQLIDLDKRKSRLEQILHH